MKFSIHATRTRTTAITEKIVVEINITKAEVMRVTDCPAKEDGDSTAWYGYVEEALLDGAVYQEISEEVEEELDVEESSRWDSLEEVEWL